MWKKIRQFVLAILVCIAAVMVGQFYSQKEYLKRRAALASASADDRTPNVNDRASTRGEDWAVDEELERISKDVACQFAVYSPYGVNSKRVLDSEGNTVSTSELFAKPAVLRGFMDTWPAMQNATGWSRSRFLSKFGKKTIAFDSNVMMAYRDRKSELKFFSVQKALSLLRQSDSTDLVVYDVSVTNSIAELRKDFSVPPPFSEWANEKTEEKENAWHVLSIGASRSGLPFHSHGSTYLGLVHGLKRWFVYPPGINPPSLVQQRSNPLLSVWDWFTTVYPLFSSLKAEYAPFPGEVGNAGSTSKSQSQKSSGYRPLECIQRPGDIIYIPAGWLHQTLNIGESVGVGSQSLFKSSDRYDFFKQILKDSPKNFDALKNVGISGAYLAMEEESRVKYSIKASTANGMIRLNPQSRSDDFKNLVLKGEDTWFVQYFLQGDDYSRALALLWNRVAEPLKGLLSIGAIEVPSKEFDPEAHAFVVHQHNLSQHIDANGKFTQQIARMFLGNRHSVGDASMEAVVSAAVDFDLTMHQQDESGLGIGPTTLPQTFVDYAISELANDQTLTVGSSTEICAKSKRLYAESHALLDECLKMQPLNPEVRGILPDILAYAGLPEYMREVMNETIRIFDPLAGTALALDFNKNLPFRPSKLDPNVPKTVTSIVLAPVYHLMAEVYLSHNFGNDALPLLQKALSLKPAYGPALIDTISAHIATKDRKSTEEAIEAAVASGVMLKSHPKLRQIREYLDTLDDLQEQRQQGKNVRDPASANKFARRGQPRTPPKSMRSSKPQDDATPTVTNRGRVQAGQQRGMDRDQAEKFAKDKMGKIGEKEYMEQLQGRARMQGQRGMEMNA